jgi:transcriptional regulator with XRE-family HTH domain
MYTITPALLKLLRNSQGMTQADMAKLLRMSQPYYAQLESGFKPLLRKHNREIGEMFSEETITLCKQIINGGN